GCRTGACGSCKGRILEGLIDFGPYQEQTLTEAERRQGFALFCCAKPLSNLLIECQDLKKSNGAEVKTLPARVQSLELLNEDVMLMTLKLPANENFTFQAGQYIDILLKDGLRRSFSLANPPANNSFLELHIRKVDGGLFTSQVFNELKEKTILRIQGPLGTFCLQPEQEKPIIFMAGGTGFAPIKSIIEHHIKQEQSHRPLMLYWGARSLNGLYLKDLALSWQQEYPFFTFTPVLSQPQPEDHWTGRTGYVHQAILDDFSDLSSYQIYACGSPEMIQSGQDTFIQQGLHPENYFTDAFLFQAPSSGTPTQP
ncbi:MAG: CDP-6-deoxy-delta-3,4-glucoseen reductase, partial [Pseudomonadota bacterium]|nr:CDP-6-deoxy-delta-3,4-glucoseen reductase [Pseudomonadota bacterium]